MPTRVLVTGGGGFIGSRLSLALLERGHEVTVLDVRPGRLGGERHPNLRFVGLGSDPRRGGMVDRDLVAEATAGVEVVFHLALNWDAGTWRRTLPPAEAFDINVRGTLNLLDAALEGEVQHFLFAGSEAVYGRIGGRLIDEEAACEPQVWERGDPGPAYAILKLATEKLCLMYYHQHRLPVTVFRVWVAFDDDEAQVLSGPLLDKIAQGESIEIAEGEGRPSIHVAEIVDAFILATTNDRAYGQVFNLLNPMTYISSRELYELVIASTASGSKIKLVPSLGAEPGLESIEKVRRTLRWEPRKTRKDLEQAVVRTVRSLK